MPRLYSIGDVHEMTGLSVSALRYYADMKVVCPVRIDRQTGYRYYDFDDIQRLKTVGYLKKAGFSRETAVRMINSSIVLQPEPHIFSTVDLASIDLYTGICEFLKIGSAASFIRRERNVECIRGTGLPAGISSELPLDP